MKYFDVYSRLMMDRIIFLGGEVNGDTMDTIVAQMLFLDSQNHDPIHLYINSGGGECYSGLELVSVMRYIHSPTQNSGHTIEEIEALCDRDKWMKAEEAIRLGFLDEIIERKDED